MGMSIDGIKQELVKILAFAVSEKQYNAVRNALIIIDKYQKIKEIVVHYKENVRDKVTNENMEKILEVVEDGTN